MYPGVLRQGQSGYFTEMTDDLALDYPGPRCIITKGVNEELKIRIEYLKYFEHGKEFKIALDNIHLTDKTSQDIYFNEHPLSVKCILIIMFIFVYIYVFIYS